MKLMKFGVLATTTVAASLMTTSALAGSVIVDGLGGAVLMNSREIPGVFGSGSPEWTQAALQSVHSDLHSSGIQTDRAVTFILADTDHGLTFMSLVDDPTASRQGDPIRSQIGMSSTAPDTGVEFVNDNGEDIQQIFDPPNGTQTAAGFHTWNAQGSGDGFAWASLNVGDFVTFSFTRNGPDFPTHPGIRRNDAFQFVSWNGEAWEVVATGEFSVADQFAFSFTVIPLPAPVLLGVAGLGVVAVLRRRNLKMQAD